MRSTLSVFELKLVVCGFVSVHLCTGLYPGQEDEGEKAEARGVQ